MRLAGRPEIDPDEDVWGALGGMLLETVGYAVVVLLAVLAAALMGL